MPMQMIFKTLALLGALCAVAVAQDPENKFEINTQIIGEQCGGTTNRIANPRICFRTGLDINKEAVKGQGPYDGYSSSDGHRK